MKTSLITTLYNENASIEKFLESFKNFSMLPDEIVIVDGGSTDGTIEKIQGFINKKEIPCEINLIIDTSCTLKHSKSPVAKGRNVAIKNAKYDIIVVTDAGCTIDKYWFEEITKPFRENPDLVLVAGWTDSISKTRFQKCISKTICPNLNKVLKNPDNFLPSSRSVAFKKFAWEKVGGYPETYLTGEDTLFDIKLKEQFGSFYIAQNAIVYWNLRNTLRDFMKMNYRYGLGDGFEKISVHFFIKALIRLCFYILSSFILFYFGGIIFLLIIIGLILLLMIFSDNIYSFVVSILRDFMYATGFINGFLGYDLQTGRYIKK